MSDWQTFYEIIGCAGATLISVQFVVIVLLASMQRRVDHESTSAFGTPTVVHFGSALSIASIMSAPWHASLGMSLMLTLCGIISLSFVASVFRRAGRTTDYQPDAEDWFWYAILPCGCYILLIIAASLLRVIPGIAPFMIGGIALGLLLIGVHNAWDSVTHILVSGNEENASTKS